MTSHRVEHEGGSGLSSHISPTSHTFSITDLRKIVSASPLVARLLPGLMRALADDLEREACARPVPPERTPATGLHRPLDLIDPLEVEAAALQVASGLSITLGHHLARSLGPRTSGPSVKSGAPGTPGRSVHEASVQLPRASAETSTKASIVEVARGTDEMPPGFPSSQPRLELRLLGTPEISVDGTRLNTLDRCGRSALVIYILALHRRGLSGERLAACIASDEAQMDAFDTDANMTLGAVRTFIWRLRKFAGWRGIVVSPGEHGGCQNMYRLPDDTTCDLWEFEAYLNAAERLAVRASIEPEAADQAAALRQDAILLYGGDFCKGIGAGSVSHAAEYLRHRYLQAVMLQAAYWKDKAIKLQEAHQEDRKSRDMRDSRDVIKSRDTGRLWVDEESAWLQALSNYRLAAQVEPYDESAYVGAMLCQAHLGQAKGVQKTLALCSGVLHAELDRNPLPTTMRTARECIQIASSVAYV